MRFAFSCALAVLSATSLSASPSDYTFRNIVDTAGGTFTKVSNAAINVGGLIAFNGVLADGTSGIFTGYGVGAFADNSTSFGFNTIGRPAVGSAGEIVFAATTKGNGATGIFDGRDPSFVRVPQGAYSGVKDPVADGGKIAFWGVYGDNNVQGIFTGPNPATDTVADANTFPFFADLVGPRIIDINGAVAFIAGTKDFQTGIFIGPNVDTDTIVDSSGLIGGIKSFDINNYRQVIMAVQLDDETPALLKGINALTDQIPLDDFGFAGDHLAINNVGDIVFDGQTRDGKAGLFTGAAAAADRVIMVGDELFGAPLKDLFWDNPGFNDKGEIAFTYRLQDDTWGIAVATPNDGTPPSAIPLPAALPATALLACVFAAHSTWRALRASMPA